MARHYIKVPAFVRDYFPGGAPANWREAIILDATDNGKRLTVEPMLPNERGPRIGVHGDRFHFWLGRDDQRLDTLFVMRMEPAREPRQQVHDYFGSFELWPGGNPGGFDSVAGLFGQEEEPELIDEQEPSQPEPSPLLIKAVAGLPFGIVGLFRPTADVAAPLDLGRDLEAFRRFWRRNRLKGRLDLAPRLESVLQGAVTPSHMDPAEWRILSNQFGIGALNAVALDDPPSERLEQVVSDLGGLSLDAHSRVALWVGLLRGLRASDLRRELSEAAPQLLAIARQGAEAERLIEEGILRALKEVAVREDDSTLHDVAAAGGLAEDPLTHFANWAQTLDFEEPREEKLPSANPESPSNAITARRPGIDRWIARVSFPDSDELNTLVSEVGLAVTGAGSPASEGSLADLVTKLDVMVALRDRLQAGMSRLPNPAEVVELGRQAQAAVGESIALIGDQGTETLLATCTVGPDDLLDVLKLVRSHDLVRAPNWLVWPDQDPPFELATATPFDLAVLLGDPERRHRCQKFIDLLTTIGEPATVRWLRPPVGGASVEEALEDWCDGTRAFLDAMSPEERVAALTDPGMSPAAQQELDRDLADLVSQLSNDAAGWTAAAVNATPRAARLALTRLLAQRVAEFRRSTKLRSSLITAGMLEDWASQPTEPLPAATITVQHNWVGLKGARASLTLVQDNPDRDLGFFEAPLVLESSEARELTLRMRWDVKGDWRADWPPEYPSIEPEQLSIAKYQWRRDDDSEPYHHTFRLRVPVRVYRDRRKRLELAASIEDAATNEVILQDLQLRWDSLQDTAVPVSVVWSTAGRTDDVDQHPIGPQARASAILDRLAALSCTAVIAPRRFGKTTLVNYLAKALPDRGVYVPPPIVCTEHRLSGGVDYAALWSQVSDALYTEFDTGIPGGWSGPLPPDNAFDAVRRAAHKRGHAAIALLFDEAQLFFSTEHGHDLGSKLKTRLERSWCLPSKGMAPLLFCFVGLPPLVQRAGADLTGMLVPIEARGMTEEELRPLVASKMPLLQSTKGLRAELARTAGNLYILRVLLNRLAERVSREQRLWASIDDLTAVNRALAQDLREGREESLAAYIRDVLNEADDVNVWTPMACVPVASAVAEVRHASTSTDDLERRAAERLNEWSRASFAETRGRPVYDKQAVRDHLGKLMELKVLDHAGQFQSPFLDAWLAGLARRWTADDAFRDALFRGGQRRIRVPSGAQPVHEVGGTRILKADDPHGPLAFRVRRLDGPRDREVFLENMAMFDALRAAGNRGEDGSAFIFRLEDVGLSSADAGDAIQVYRWVDGEDLRSKAGALGAEHVLDIGIKLSRALTLLHRKGVLHRDIQPGNVIIDEGEHASDDLRPVFIDFGFARVVGRQMGTRLAGEFAAPEVCAAEPEWSRVPFSPEPVRRSAH